MNWRLKGLLFHTRLAMVLRFEDEDEDKGRIIVFEGRGKVGKVLISRSSSR